MTRTHTIVHIEDDAASWQPLTTSLEVAIGEELSRKSENALVSLASSRPLERDTFPALTKITWQDGDEKFEVNYWLLDAVRIDGIVEDLAGNRELTFILDVMRSSGGPGLHSTLLESLSSIKKYVSDQTEQVRLFTAYSDADGVNFPSNAPIIIKKGIETSRLIDFLLRRIGFGAP